MSIVTMFARVIQKKNQVWRRKTTFFLFVAKKKNAQKYSFLWGFYAFFAL